MNTLLVLLTLIAADADSKPRKPSAIAPSLPALTKEEERKIEDIIDRFILADSGRLGGTAGRKAIQEFEKLGAESIPALIRGLNRAAKLNQTCPVLTINKKLTKLLLASDDQVLLEFARDEIGADVGQTKYASTLKDLRLKVTLRKNALARLGPSKPATPATPKGPAQMSTADLAKAASTARGEALKGVIQELAKRDGKEALAGLTVAANSYEADVQKLARESMDASLGRVSTTGLSNHLEDDNVEVRRSAIRVVAAKHPRLVPKIIDRLEDDSAEVRAEARAALKTISKGEDFGPESNASKSERAEAKKKWRDWWDQQRK
jgi:HEAT repeat protein